VGAVPGVRDAAGRLVWDPPWDPQKMSDEAKLELGNAVSVGQSGALGRVDIRSFERSRETLLDFARSKRRWRVE
jgi:metal-sulfur cluster biosynthetic enzyme